MALHAYDRASLMWSGIADAVSAPADASQSPDERALQFLADRSALVLDNLEQITDADVVVSRLLTDGLGCGCWPPLFYCCISSTSRVAGVAVDGSGSDSGRRGVEEV